MKKRSPMNYGGTEYGTSQKVDGYQPGRFIQEIFEENPCDYNEVINMHF
jgi:hypothetical protein